VWVVVQVKLLLVSKTKPVGMIQEAYDGGSRLFGENYIQEFVEKAPSLPKDIEWHFIGHIQTNKVRQLLSMSVL
jgi:PLP dependent protein